MRRYTDYLSNALAKELQAKGMDVELVDDSVEERPYEHPFHCETTITEAVDWLRTKHIIVEVRDNSLHEEPWTKRYRGRIYRDDSTPGTLPKVSVKEFSNWNEAMEDAIRYALKID